MFMNNILALVGLTVSGAMASDVYSTFYSQNGQITPNFDVSNTGCFSAENAMTVSFSQSGPGNTFNGPYCLSAFTEAGCPGSPSAKQNFKSLHRGSKYGLSADVAFAGSFKWAPTGC